MLTLSQRWARIWHGDAQASDLAMQGEHRLAKGRFVLVAALTVLGLVITIRAPDKVSYARAIPVNLACLALAFAALVATRQGQRPTWLATATALGDVTLVSLLHVLELAQGTPSVAVNGRITFMGYFFALLGTCVRWDRRIAIGAGVMAAAQYAGIAAIGASMWPQSLTADILAYGDFDWGVQTERVLTLILFGLLCGAIAHWALQLREYATTDQLTRLANRRTFEERIRDELLKAGRHRSDISVVMVDLDHFKDVNDIHGHHAGDHVLREVAETLRLAVRRTDLVGRWGGEEFALAFLDASHDEAAQKAELLRTVLERSTVTLPNGEEVSVTLSAGVATASLDGSDLETLVKAADRRLLEAKRAGRNRVVTCAAAAV